MPNGITTDQLNIKITVDSSGAIDGIDKVKEALGQLKDVAGSRNLTTLKEVADQFTSLSTAAGNLASIDFSGMGASITSFFSSLSGAANPALPAHVQTMADAFTKLAGPLSDFTKNTTGLTAAASGITKIQDAVTKFGTGPSPEQIANLAQPLRDIGQAVGKVGKGGNNLNQMRIAIQNMTDAVKNFNPGNVDRLGPFLEKLQDQVNKFSDGAQKGASAMYRIGNALRSLNTTGFEADLAKNIESAAKAVADFANKVVNSIPKDVYNKFIRLGEAISSMTHIGAANRSVNSFANSLKRAHSHSSNFSKSMKKVRNSVLQTLFPFKSIAKSVTNFGNAFKKLGSTIQRLVLYRFLRSMIRAITQQVKLGIDALYNWSDVVGYRFKAAMDGLATSFQYLRNSVAAMLSPLVEYLQPVIDSLIDRFVEFLNVVNQFIATMTGKDTYVRAIKGAAKYAEETGYAAAAQEKLNRTVLGFDELNKLNDTDDRGRGSPTADAGGGEFEELPITESFGKIDWSNLGKKLSDGLATALGSINWQSIQKKTKGVVQKVIGFINSFFGNEEMWTEVGLTVSGGINTLTTAITTFADKGKWKAIGANIQAAFMAAVGDINWENLGKSLVATFKIFANLFIGFISGMTEEDWKELGTKIGEAVSAAIQDIPWAELIGSLSSFATGLFNALIAAIQTIPWPQVWDEIKKAWDNLSPVLKVVAVFEGVKALTGIKLFTKGLSGGGGLIKTIGLAVSSMGGWAAIIALVSAALVALGYIMKDDLAEKTKEYREESTKTAQELQKQYKNGEISFAEYSNKIQTMTYRNHKALEITLPTWQEFFGSVVEGIRQLNGKVPDAEKAGGEIPQAIARGVKNNRKAITEVNGEIVADFTGIRLPDMSVKGSNIPKSLAQGIKNNKNAITKVNGEIIADFTGLKTPDKSEEGSKFARNVAKGVNEGKPTVKSSIDALARTLNITMPDLSSAGNGVSTSLAKGITAKKSDVQSAVTGISNAIKLLNKDNDNSPLYPWTWGNDFAASFASGLSSTSAIKGVTTAASTIAAKAREYLAFSKPEKGPLSDADMYGPDFMKLYAQGIENSKNLVTNAVSGLASDVNNAMALENTYTLHNEPTGLDSLAQAITNSETPINVYIGSDKLDSVIARSNSRLNYRSGGRF